MVEPWMKTFILWSEIYWGIIGAIEVLYIVLWFDFGKPTGNLYYAIKFLWKRIKHG
jgi:hypothetical protein